MSKFDTNVIEYAYLKIFWGVYVYKFKVILICIGSFLSSFPTNRQRSINLILEM